MAKPKSHRYKKDDMVGICTDCMADCRIVEVIPKKKGQSLSYVASAVSIHHPKPKESFFGKNKKFTVRENQITVKLGWIWKKQKNMIGT